MRTVSCGTAVAAICRDNQSLNFLNKMKCEVGESVPETNRLRSGMNPWRAVMLTTFPDLMKILMFPVLRRDPLLRRRADGLKCSAGAYSQGEP